jgi:hypothetical protein
MAGLVTAEEKVLRKALENARMIASKATAAVKVFVVKKELAVAVGSLGVSVMRK